MPKPNTAEERELIEQIIEPVVIQLINNDIAPSIPTCTLPGQQGSAAAVVKEEIDVESTFRATIEQAFANIDMPEGIDFEDLIDDSIPSSEFMEAMDIESEAGVQEVTRVVEAIRKALDHSNGNFSEDEPEQGPEVVEDDDFEKVEDDTFNVEDDTAET